MKRLIGKTTIATQAVLNYINAANGVCRYVGSINGVSIPDLIQPPPSYGDYAASFGNVRLHVMDWMNEVIPSFNLIPQSFLNFSQTIQGQLTTIACDLQQLSVTGDHSSMEQTIRDTVAILQVELERCQQAVNGLDVAIARYQQSLQPDAKNLTSLAAEMLTAADADQTAINQQNAVLANFNQLINDRNQVATLDTLGNWDFNIFIAVAGVAIGLPFSPVAGIIVGLVFGIGTASFTSFYAINQDPVLQQSVAEIQETINRVDQQIGWLNTAISLVQAVNSQLTSLVTECDTVRGQLATVLDFWNQQQQGLTAMLNDLNDLLSQLTAPSGLAQAQADVKAAQDSWQELASFMEDIAGIQYVITSIPAPTAPTTPAARH